jgi:hypothetical protein
VSDTYVVGSEGELNAAITAIDVGGSNASTDTAYTIDITATISLGAALEAINLANGSTLTIAGTNGSSAAQTQTIDGNSAQRGLFVYNGTVTLENLAITHAVAHGGDGGLAAAGGGGGAGLGGGLFVASGGEVTLDNVSFTGDKAIGGDGQGAVIITAGIDGESPGFLVDKI